MTVENIQRGGDSHPHPLPFWEGDPSVFRLLEARFGECLELGFQKSLFAQGDAETWRLKRVVAFKIGEGVGEHVACATKPGLEPERFPADESDQSRREGGLGADHSARGRRAGTAQAPRAGVGGCGEWLDAGIAEVGILFEDLLP